MITVLVEGDTDVPFVARLCEASGFEMRAPRIAGGKHRLDPLVPGFARAAKGSPHLVVRDLDLDADCPAEWIDRHAPPSSGRYFMLRLAVRAVEAWFLADREAASAALHLAAQKIPRNPDEEPDPKRAIVNLARRSSKPSIQRALIPAPGSSRKAGPGYETWLLGAAERWSLARAEVNSPSLARARRRLTELQTAWASIGGST